MQNNGAYVLSEWIHNDTIQLVRNPFWYGWTEMADVVGNIEVINMSMNRRGLDRIRYVREQ